MDREKAEKNYHESIAEVVSRIEEMPFYFTGTSRNVIRNFGREEKIYLIFLLNSWSCQLLKKY
ncbi:hypothetical protein HYT56_02895 [Candidatus Woesearchaeota archaeon]|nr:hypothetical protein [Candidatus Woesearchaeota archaeon]